MFTEKHFPTSVCGDVLDDYLARAWYRMGLSIFTCHFLFLDESLYSPIWLRLPLEGYVFRKNLQKTLRQNRARFQLVIKHSVVDEEKETLFQKYRQNFKGKLSATLQDSLLDGQNESIFDSFEVNVYDGERLVAYSFFDLGNTSIASIKGVYDPDYAAYSLGMYTMLEEIQFGKDLGFQFFYPGYFVPGYARFDYKKRMGTENEVQYFDLKTHGWCSLKEFSNQSVPVNVISQKLNALAQALSAGGILAQMLYYPAYEANAFQYDNERLLESPLFLTLYTNVFPRPRFIIYYDLWKEKFVFTHCMPIDDLGLYFQHTMQFDTQEARHYLDYILKKTQIVETNDIGIVVRLALEISRLIKLPGAFSILK